ncbi:MAG: hypothetical protein ACOX8E_10370 [Ruminococcus sp.]|jgi:hypothetical protein
MKKFVIVGIWVLTLALAGCAKKKEESVPLVTEEEMQPENEEIPEADIDSELKSFEFSVQGVTCRLPAVYDDMTEKGWKYEGDEEEKVAGESFLENRKFSLGSYTCTVDMTNFSAENQPVNQCYVGRVVLEPGKHEEKIILPGGLAMGEATAVQVQDAYGEPRDRYEDDSRIIFTYEYGVYENAVLTFEADTEIMVKAELCNQMNPEEQELYENAGKKKTPEVEQYQSPLDVTDNLMDFTVEYGGSIYQLPAPVSAFTEDGWEIDEESSDEAVKSGKYGYVTLMRGGQNFYAVVYNYGDGITAVNNCFVTSVHGDLVTTKVPIRVARGITLGMPKEDFLAAIEGLDWEETPGQDGNTTVFTFYQNEEKLNYTEVTLDNDLAMISGIQLVHFREKEGESE